MAKIRLSRQANEDLNQIVLDIMEQNPVAALQLHDFVWRRLNQLRAHPRSGRPGIAAGTSELVVNKNYIVVYEFDDEDEVLVLAIHYAGQDWRRS